MLTTGCSSSGWSARHLLAQSMGTLYSEGATVVDMSMGNQNMGHTKNADVYAVKLSGLLLHEQRSGRGHAMKWERRDGRLAASLLSGGWT